MSIKSECLNDYIFKYRAVILNCKKYFEIWLIFNKQKGLVYLNNITNLAQTLLTGSVCSEIIFNIQLQVDS